MVIQTGWSSNLYIYIYRCLGEEKDKIEKYKVCLNE